MNKRVMLVSFVCIFLLAYLVNINIAFGKSLYVTDVAGRKVKVNIPADRIILQGSGSGGAFLTVLALEGKDTPKKIAGWDLGLKLYRRWMWKKFSGALPELENIPDVGTIYKQNFNLEKVVALKPDVVIVPLHAYQKCKDTVEKLESSGVPVVFIDYHKETLENHIKSILLIGKILGKEERAKQLADFYKKQVNEVYSRLKEIKKPKPKVYVEIGCKAWGNTYGNCMWGALVKQCGGINIAEGKIERWGRLNPEYIIEENPDVIVITGSYWPKYPDSVRLGYYANLSESLKLLKNYINRPGWKNLNAIKNKRVYSIHHGLSRNIWDFAAIQFLAKCFYPEEFKDINPEESLKEFHQKFLPVKYSGVWMMSLNDQQ